MTQHVKKAGETPGLARPEVTPTPSAGPAVSIPKAPAPTPSPVGGTTGAPAPGGLPQPAAPQPPQPPQPPPAANGAGATPPVGGASGGDFLQQLIGGLQKGWQTGEQHLGQRGMGLLGGAGIMGLMWLLSRMFKSGNVKYANFPQGLGDLPSPTPPSLDSRLAYTSGGLAGLGVSAAPIVGLLNAARRGAQAPAGYGMQRAIRGGASGAGTSLGAGLGASAGTALTAAFTQGMDPQTRILLSALAAGAGGLSGGYLGNRGTHALLGEEEEPRPQSLKAAALRQGATNTIGQTAAKRQVGPVTRGTAGKYTFHKRNSGGRLTDDPTYSKYQRTKSAAEFGREVARLACSNSSSRTEVATNCQT